MFIHHRPTVVFETTPSGSLGVHRNVRETTRFTGLRPSKRKRCSSSVQFEMDKKHIVKK